MPRSFILIQPFLPAIWNDSILRDRIPHSLVVRGPLRRLSSGVGDRCRQLVSNLKHFNLHRLSSPCCPEAILDHSSSIFLLFILTIFIAFLNVLFLFFILLCISFFLLIASPFFYCCFHSYSSCSLLNYHHEIIIEKL
ncbi:hypothetical protein L873DRAFT_363649 [Choiromyces venosus 120613-1]|uniref:Uncharacterized protein n=1 Tax=Choiromyces venosus 120613-1 TaxID=1336337 RepID=A0A3N4K0I8_9PEZI|nr:hypothetical protein L873DRAFT_363649 [Choiromyces venosus 120613-1]